MGMHIGSGSGSGEPEVMTEMNTTPLIDVMLVLLIMLILTIPVQLHSVNLNLPAGNPPPVTSPPPVIHVDIDVGGRVYWNGELLADRTALESHLQQVATQPVPPEVHIKPNKAVAYREVAAVLASAQRLGVSKLGVVGDEQYLP
ncbi:MAG TPA: biopolymer transporter ExbD [Aquabacterium sp.]|nr:biopolymer transporter ExbD [Aquabacterium sp.]